MERRSNIISDITRQSLKSNLKVLERQPSSKPKPSVKPAPKERIYASNFMEPSSSLTTGSRILHTAASGHESKSINEAKNGKIGNRQTTSSMNID